MRFLLVLAFVLLTVVPAKADRDVDWERRNGASSALPDECICTWRDRRQLKIEDWLGRPDPSWATPDSGPPRVWAVGGNGGPPEKECAGSTCKVDVRMTVQKDGTCVANLDYCKLCVRALENKAKKKIFPVVVFEIDEKDRFVFSQEELRGVVLLDDKRSEVPEPPGPGRDHFKERRRDAQKPHLFSMRAGKDETLVLPWKGLFHEARVYPVSDKKQEKRCEPRDPIIVNTGN